MNLNLKQFKQSLLTPPIKFTLCYLIEEEKF